MQHPRIAASTLERRPFQEAIARACLSRNTLVVLPTGLGKTAIALSVLAERLRQRPGQKALFLAPTKPLAEQHAAFLSRALTQPRVVVLTGETPPSERALLWSSHEAICATPQVVHNDVLAERVDLADCAIVVFDEAHRAVGDYAYPFLAERYRARAPEGRILGMTASPGAEAARIGEVCRNLGIEGVEIRTESDPDVRPYVPGIALEWLEVPMPDQLRAVADPIRRALEEDVRALREASLVRAPRVGAAELLKAQAAIQARLREAGDKAPRELYRMASLQARALKANHALELVETQGLQALQAYFERLEQDRSKAAKALLDDPRIRQARILAEGTRVEHPKLRRVALLLREQLEKKPDSRAIVFTHYRDTCELLHQKLAEVEGLRPARFVGQASRGEDKGLSQKEQAAVLQAFKDGAFNVLVATSVAEEGLDIPATDLVLFYEPVASEIRTIQRRGRTGRLRPGRVVVLLAKGTRDEAYYWSAKNKEKRMRAQVDDLRKSFAAVNASLSASAARAPPSASQAPLEAFAPPKSGESEPDGPPGGQSPGGSEASSGPSESPAAIPQGRPPAKPALGSTAAAPPTRLEIIVDHREFTSPVVRELAARDVAVKPAQLPVGDFVLSDRLGVERKTVDDLVDSLVDGRLFAQVKLLRQSYAAPVLVVEGEDLAPARRIPPAALHGALASVVADFGVPVLRTRDAHETAALLYGMARREQKEAGRPVALRGDKRASDPDDELRVVLEGVPGVSAVLAERLLRRFRTLSAVAAADEAELREVEGIGEVLARRIAEIFRRTYRG